MPTHSARRNPLRRRTAYALAAAAVTVSTVAGAAPALAAPAHAAPPPAQNQSWADRATATYAALQSRLALGPSGHGLYVENYPAQAGDNPYSYLWTYREATEAALDMSAIPHVGRSYQDDVAEHFDALEAYHGVDAFGEPGYESYVPAPLGTGGDVFYDDNAIVGLSFFSRYQQTRDRADLQHAEDQLAVVLRGWDTDPAAVCPGGENWIASPGNTTRGANITGLGAQLAAHLYETTGDASYLSWATKLYDWNETCLKQSDGLYWNSRDDDGSLNKTLWTYNSGAMIGTATILYRATHDRAWLDRAQAAASGSLEYWTADDRLYSQPAVFNEMYFDDLLLLDSVRHDPRFEQTIAAYADRIWSANRDASTGLFHFGASGGGAPDPAVRVSTLEQSAVVQIFASLSWAPGHRAQAA